MTRSDFDRQAPPTEARLRALLAVSEAIVAHHDLPALFQDLAARLRDVVRFDHLAFVLHDAATDTMRLHVLGAHDSILNGPRSHSILIRIPPAWCGNTRNRISSRAWRISRAGQSR